MTTARIANIVGTEADRASVNPRVHQVPADMIGPGFSVDTISLQRSIGMLNDVDHAICELTFVEAGVRAEALGYAAILISPPLDYGVRLLRSVVGIPVIGGGQAAMQVAASLGRRFAIVTVWPKILRPRYERVIADNGFEKLCVGVRFVTEDRELPSLLGADGLIRTMGTTKSGALLDRIEASARQAMADGAEAIVLGCTCMAPIRDDLAARLDGVPVIDPLVAGYKYAEMMVGLGLVQQQGATSAHRGELRAMIGQLGGVAEEVCEDACPILTEVPQAGADMAAA